MKDIIDFDDYSKEYNELMDNQLSVFTDDVSYFAEYKIEETKKTLKTPPKNILDFGCGVGRNINFFKKHFPLAKISGCDISQKSIDIAKKSFPESDFLSLKTFLNHKILTSYLFQMFFIILLSQTEMML